MPPKPETKPDENPPPQDHLQALLHLTTATNTRLDVLTTNMTNLVFQAENYFTYYNIPPNQRLALAVFYFTGDALSWYTHMSTNHLLGTWPEFTQALETRFGPSTYENHRATLFKLRQTSTVAAYQSEFEKTSNCVVGLPTEALRDCFISGLREDIQSEIAIQNPLNLHQTYGLAKLIEEKFSKSRPRPTYTPRSLTYNNTQQITPISTTNQITTQPPLLSTPPKPKPTIPFTRLSPEALQKRRVEGLCFRCPEKFRLGHICNPPQFFLIADNEDTSDATQLTMDVETTTNDTITDTITDQTPHFLSLSEAAFFGLQSPRTLRVTGHINGHPVTTLIDCGSTYNIIQPRLVSLLKTTPATITPFPVMVGNGQHLECNSFFPNVPLELNKTTFSVPLFVLPVEGADVILGVTWLSTLGPLVADFSIPQLSFTINNHPCILRGEPLTSPVSPSSLHTLIRKNSVASFHTLICHHQPPATIHPNRQPHPNTTIEALLHQYQKLFDPPHELPPTRQHDHHIPLFPNTKPINVKPYRYPHYQKEIMTNLISDMLDSGVIQPSQSPYSSPILLVQKKDGTWRFCVDIGHSMQSQSGYHQIRVSPADIHKTAFRTIDGHYEFRVMPFGLTNAPSTFQAAMNDLFRVVLRKFVLVFFDDILVYSPSMDKHCEHLQFVFHTLLTNKYHAKESKCVFCHH
ncbi:uncharacterized protein LOC111901634 [Lactuca sativa]|uniref:uncharacterized protein LOC111901634 n=1 Tax=Lactuca sativa TaxID=4236 RepID=UPI000CD92A6E|nr:uncharacterized protein LOC111901634 [Lactuca sativa]